MGLFDEHDIKIKSSGTPKGLFGQHDQTRRQYLEDYRLREEARHMNSGQLQLESSKVQLTAQKNVPVHVSIIPVEPREYNHPPLPEYNFQPVPALPTTTIRSNQYPSLGPIVYSLPE
ncbi:hypothetical protein COW36_03510 [bacterium (Candidatus Blackallbacteria) CG17_big_fil_post_rev_8_21_14_2_50_48_46]|uniref:Uncharacterized protein n=1 Tax=bacterium (Candidatus Blackallbacteria) CG17_big_fil_post_rev_8_21_14_2_50_48_46 TaxID=2014261 RepID=A0A2M7G9J5_9BACT|nr:MAG: hypothetical protein COW64_25930 [bacterium (Candidatus Blackallbacteria) CG18_big_fil_WC_8_21_14_2_50_49_26]PIW18778.1 MAG: hypothetical protein COW36_03510 [bacterium (Candidatus Blackallbacteria) CG17_big_fil_post_rev_8_21_14_2_50_48_46]